MKFIVENYKKFLDELIELCNDLKTYDDKFLIYCRHDSCSTMEKLNIYYDIDENEFDDVSENWNVLSYSKGNIVTTMHNQVQWVTKHTNDITKDLTNETAEHLEEIAQKLEDYVLYFDELYINIFMSKENITLSLFVNDDKVEYTYNSYRELFDQVCIYKDQIGKTFVPILETVHNVKYSKPGIDQYFDNIRIRVSIPDIISKSI